MPSKVVAQVCSDSWEDATGNLADLAGSGQYGRYMYISLRHRMESRPVKFAASQRQWPQLYELSKIGPTPLEEAEHDCPCGVLKTRERSQSVHQRRKGAADEGRQHITVCA